MDLKIRLSESLDSRLRLHAQNTGATLNSIVCLAINSFVPGEVLAGTPPLTDPVVVFEPTERQKTPIFAPERPLSGAPKLSAKPTKDERRKLAEWYRKNPAAKA